MRIAVRSACQHVACLSTDLRAACRLGNNANDQACSYKVMLYLFERSRGAQLAYTRAHGLMPGSALDTHVPRTQERTPLVKI